MISLKRAYKEVLEYQKTLGYDFSSMPLPARLIMLRDYHTALSIEQAELLNEVPWKPWRPIKRQGPIDNKKVALEWADCLIFLFDQAACLQITPEEIENAFTEKMNINALRISSGYNCKPKNEKDTSND